MDEIVIVGAGECGTRAAFAAREAGYSGTVTLVGNEPHLPYERPPLSKPMDGAVQLKAICTAEALQALGIRYLQGVAASQLDTAARSVKLSSGTTISYDRLLLATGARPRGISCVGSERALEFRMYSDADAIFARADKCSSVAIIGGGLIGMELAAVLRSKGMDVGIVEVAPKPLGRAVPTRFAESLHAKHVKQGVKFHLGQAIREIADDAVVLADGSVAPGEMVVTAIGVVPEVALAEAAGIATGNGILTDRFLCTTDPNVFAAGDCAAVSQLSGGHMRFESWRNARAQGETAGRNMAGGNEPFAAIPWFWSDQYDLGLQVVGLPQQRHQRVIRTGQDGELEFYLDAGRLVAAAGLGVGNTTAKDIKLAEMLIAAGAMPDISSLVDPGINLKALLKTARAA